MPKKLRKWLPREPLLWIIFRPCSADSSLDKFSDDDVIEGCIFVVISGVLMHPVLSYDNSCAELKDIASELFTT